MPLAADTDLDRFLRVIWRPGDVREVRVPTGRGADAGYFDDPDAIPAAVARYDGRQNAYITLNPVQPALLARAANRIKSGMRSTTSDAHVVERRWLPIDIDPKRPSDVSSSEDERQAALAAARAVYSYLTDLGWPAPVTAMSGNGYWLLYPVALPNDESSTALVAGVLAHLAGRFNRAEVEIDTTVSNASRIATLVGTLKVKGDATGDRPHRRSSLILVPPVLTPVPREALAALVPAPQPRDERPDVIRVGGDRMPAGWVKQLLDDGMIEYREGTRSGRTWFRLERCPFHPDDDQGGDCGVGEDAAGKGLGHCFHNRGAGKGWKDFRAALGMPAPLPGAIPNVIAPRTHEEVDASSIDAADLLELDIAPLQWIVPDLLPEGTTVLAGPPKLGKSCLVYQIAVEVALGGELLGRAIEQGDVLYLALEDGKRRGQTRLRAALGSRRMPRGRLEVRWSTPKLGDGLEAELVDWLDRHQSARLVAIDTLQRVRARGDARRNAYEVDVEDLARLQDIFKDRAVGLLIVHHSKKDAGDDFLASVSGTYGITGSADTTLVIQRKRLETFGKLVVTGRDVEEIEEPVQFNGMTWSSAPRSLAEASFEQAEVYKVIEADGPLFAKAIADQIGSTREAAQRLVEKLVMNGSVARARGGYVVANVRIAEDGEEADGHEMTVSASSASSSPRARARACVTTTSASSASSGVVEEEEEEVGTRVTRARDADWLHPCRDYARHQSFHRQTPDGYVCDACADPEEDA